MVFNLPNGWMGAAALQPSMNRLSSWWFKTVKDTPKEVKKGLNSLIILVAWEIWKHRNDCVFNGASPRISLVYCWSKGTPRNSVWVAPPGRLVSPRGGGVFRLHIAFRDVFLCFCRGPLGHSVVQFLFLMK